MCLNLRKKEHSNGKKIQRMQGYIVIVCIPCQKESLAG